MKSAPGLLTLISLAFPCQICLATILYVPGGTENVASTKMTKSLAVNGSIDDDGDVESETGGDTKTGSKTNGARSEGTRKSLEAMFDSMAPIKKKNKRTRGDDDSSDDDDDDDDGGNKRRRGGGRGGGGDNPKPEAGFGFNFFEHILCAVASPENQIRSILACLAGNCGKKKEAGIRQNHQGVWALFLFFFLPLLQELFWYMYLTRLPWK